MTYIASQRIEWSVDAVIGSQLPGGAGEYLRYEPVYDDIKEARREDDPQLSQGVWQREIKRASWTTVEHLCVDALTHTTRDLQIALWLTEALCVMDGPSGLIRGLKLTYGMASTFWDVFYPLDEDFRIPLWEWVDHEIHRRLVMLPLTKSGYTYSDWLNAMSMESVRQRAVHRVPDDAVSISDFRKSLVQTVHRPFTVEQTDDLLHVLSQIRDLLETHYLLNAPGLTVIRRTAGDIRSLLLQSPEGGDASRPATQKDGESISDEAQAQEEVSESGATADESEEKVISERKHAYQAIREIGQFLSILEPHSPAPPILMAVGTWENTPLSGILKNIRENPDMKVLLRMLLLEAE